MQRIFDFFNNTSLEREKVLSEKIVSLTEKVSELENQIIALNEHIEQLDKGYSAMTYIVESHNALLVELTGISKSSASNQSNNSTMGGLTKLPEMFSGNKNKKPN